jgi:3-oxoacyl-[acyl-carrier protein] reductase
MGRALAEILVESGAEIAINYRSKDETAKAVARYIENLGVDTWVYPADINKVEDVQKMKKTLSKYFGKIDVLINNAGLSPDILSSSMDGTAWNNIIAQNMNGILNCTNTFLDDLLLSEHGRIINITSMIGQKGNASLVNFAISKTGVIGLTNALANELAGKNVTVNAVTPGLSDSVFPKVILGKPWKKSVSKMPTNPYGHQEGLSRAIAFLASDESDNITGQVIGLNGGMYPLKEVKKIIEGDIYEKQRKQKK